MRSVGVLLEFCVQVLFLSNRELPGSAAHKRHHLTRLRSRSKRQAGRPTVIGTAGMVLSAIVQFLKRVCILVIGLFRLTYRKVLLVHAAS